LTNVDPGYRAENVLTMRATLPRNQYDTHERMLTFFDRVEREVSALPSVRAAGWGTALPLDGSPFGNAFEIVGAPPVEEVERPIATYQMISTRYLQTVGIAIVRGRGFDERDVSAAKPVCLVNEEFARRYLQGRDPIGAQIRVGAMGLGSTNPVTREIVGIVRQVKERPQELTNPLAIYVPLAQNAWTYTHLAVRAETSEPEALAPTIRAAVARVDPNLPLTRVRTLDDIGREATSRPRFRAQLVTAFAAVALILATVGLFGVLAFSVQQRVPEFGVRLALGATPSDVLGIVLAKMARITVGGVGLGLFAAALLSRSLEGLLFGVKALDALTFAIVAAIGVATAMIASAVPAYRAARVDPLVALRYE
jgi:putative ABC transport system permease protein